MNPALLGRGSCPRAQGWAVTPCRQVLMGVVVSEEVEEKMPFLYHGSRLRGCALSWAEEEVGQE